MMDQSGGITASVVMISIIVALLVVVLVMSGSRTLAQANGPGLNDENRKRLAGCFYFFILVLIAFVTVVTIYLMSPVISRGFGGEVEPTVEPAIFIVPTRHKPNVTVKTISLGDAEPFYDDDFYVGVNYISFDYVVFTIGSPGIPGTRDEVGSTGYSTIYTGRARYDVRITKINYDSLMQNMTVEFTVTKLD
jgi:hypothetical protein